MEGLFFIAVFVLIMNGFFIAGFVTYALYQKIVKHSKKRFFKLMSDF